MDALTPPRRAHPTITDLLIRLPNAQKRDALDEFRHEFEAEHGPTDPTRYYTSLWPTAQQQWLFDHEPQRWYDGLPPFVRGFFKEQIEEAHAAGRLTDLPQQWVRDFMEGRVRAPSEPERAR